MVHFILVSFQSLPQRILPNAPFCCAPAQSFSSHFSISFLFIFSDNGNIVPPTSWLKWWLPQFVDIPTANQVLNASNNYYRRFWVDREFGTSNQKKTQDTRNNKEKKKKSQ